MSFEELMRKHVATVDLDIRKKPDGYSRYMDQKVTPDVLTFIADCIVNFLGGKNPDTIFTTKDIWDFPYFQKNTVAIFSKPSPINESARAEYDKFIAQPLKTLAFAKILKEEKAYEVSGVMHCFSGDYDFALRCIDLGFYISFTGVITFPNAKEAQKTASKLPLENILIETDCPFLSPQIHRGKRNEPAYVVFVANKLSELQNVPVSEVINVTTSNAEKLFKLNY